MIWIQLVTVHILLPKSEKLVGRRRWLSSYDKHILRTLEVLMYFFYYKEAYVTLLLMCNLSINQ